MHKTVYVESVSHYDPTLLDIAVEALFASLEAPGAITANTRILLKPNLLAKHPPEHAVTTHPEVVRAVIHACVRRGARAENITIADSAGGLYNPTQTKVLYQGCGYSDLEKSEGIHLYTDCKSRVYATPNAVVAKDFDIIAPALEADFIINLPKCKTHVMTGMTAACKNMFGVVPGLKKSQWHTRFPDKERFGHMLIDLLETLPPHMAILDGVLAMEGDGPGGGSPRTMGLLLASQDMVNLDLAVAHLIGLNPMRVPYLKAAHQRGLGDETLDMTTVSGVLPAFPDWQLPSSYQNNQDGTVDFASQVPKPLRKLVRTVEAKAAPRPIIDKALCIGCGKCTEICPQNTIDLAKHKATIRHKNCIRCFCCHEVCPVKAIEVKSLSIFKL